MTAQRIAPLRKKQDHTIWTLVASLGFIVFLVVLFIPKAPAGVIDVQLAWDSNSEEDLAGYYMYYKLTASGSPYNGTGVMEGDSPVKIPLTSFDNPDYPEITFHGLRDDQVYFFAVTAYNEEDIQSSYSNEVRVEPMTAAALVGFSIDGSSSVCENGTASYTATALLSDGNTLNVTGLATWSDNSPYASISSAGIMTTTEVSATQTVTIQASYSQGTTTETATKTVTLVNVPSTNQPPDKPYITYPADGQSEVEVPTVLTTEKFSDPDGDTHKQSRWQISEDSEFTTLVLDAISESYKTNVTIPHMVLIPDTSYFVRVRFFDGYAEASAWSDPIMFTTTYHYIDANVDGIPDDREASGDIDFNLNGIPDVYEPETIKIIQGSDNMTYIGVEKLTSTIADIETLDVIPPEDIADTTNRPGDIVYDLFTYRLRLTQDGAIAKVQVYFSDGVYISDKFHKYDTVNGWYDYSRYATINDDGTSVVLELKDGGYGDSDGVANGIIVDPSGVSSGGSYSSSTATGSGSGGGGCFIATATYGSPLEHHVSILKDLRDTYLIRFSLGRALIRTYYKHSPRLALYIEKNTALKSFVAMSLAPIIGFSYLALHLGLAAALAITTFIFVFMIFLAAKLIGVITALRRT